MARSSGDPTSLSRRGVLGVAGASAAGMAAFGRAKAEAEKAGGPGAASIDLTINGVSHRLAVDPRTTLLDVLRERLGMNGAKKGCDHGQCGACTVLLDGKPALSCLTLAIAVRAPVTTIEALADNGALHPMQQAFIDQDAFQCGYCTPGQILSAVACVQNAHAGSDEGIREFMSGNLCRCAAYPHIVEAVKQAASRMRA